MAVGIATVRIYAPWVHSLKEKRTVVKSICAKVRNKFNVSIAEVGNQDVHQSIILGFACVAGDNSHAGQVIDTVIRFIEGNTEGDIVQIEREIV